MIRITIAASLVVLIACGRYEPDVGAHDYAYVPAVQVADDPERFWACPKGTMIAGGRFATTEPACIRKEGGPQAGKPEKVDRAGLATKYGADPSCLFEVVDAGDRLRLDVLSLGDCSAPLPVRHDLPSRAIRLEQARKAEDFGYYVCPDGRRIGGGMLWSSPVCLGNPASAALKVTARELIESVGLRPECVVSIYPRGQSVQIVARGC